MGSILVGELKAIINDIPDDYEVLMEMHHKYDIPAESGKKGWLAFINGVKRDDDFMRVKLMN